MSNKQRQDWLKKMHPLAAKRSTLPEITREWDLYDIAISTRAAPAKILGLESIKGHLGIGADADIAVYDIDPLKIDLASKPYRIIRAFSNSYLTILHGEQVSKKGKVGKTPHGSVWSVQPNLNESLWNRINSELEDMMGRWFAHSFSNYPVPDRYRSHLEQKIEVDAETIPA
jgi:formylmethanofuran dehydrogenase subunit A